MSWMSRIANAFRSTRTAAELDAELRFHLDQRIDDLVSGGISRADAELAVKRQFGSALRLRETSQEVKANAWIESILRDFRFGLRMIAKYRAASLAAVVSLALAIGTCTAAFSLIDALMFRELPVEAPRQLFDLARVFPPFMSANNQPREFDLFSYPQYGAFRELVHDSADLFLTTYSASLSPALFDDSGGVSETVRSENISGGGFGILGVKPAIGRLIQPDDDSVSDGHLVAVLSYPFWKRRFGGSPSVIGRKVTLQDKTFQIVGVVKAPFSGFQPGYLTDLWVPLSTAVDPRFLAQDVELASIWGRLRPGVLRSQVREPLQAAFTNLLRERLRANPPRALQGDRLKQFAEQPLVVRDGSTGSARDSLFRAQFRRPFLILALISALLLLVACSNVANLMLARASARDAEMALRISLGAARSRLIQQMLIESAQLAVAATVLAIVFAAAAAPAIVARLGPSEFPAFLDVAPHLGTLAFAAALSMLTTLLFGLVPALRASSASPETALKAGGGQHSARTGSLRWMLTAQIGFSVAVIFLSSLLLLSFRRLISVRLGFSPENVVLFDLAPRDPADRHQVSGVELLKRLRSLPAVHAAGISAQRPMGGDMVWIMTPIIRFPGRPGEAIRPTEIPVAGGFFDSLRIRWIAGRDFLPEEIARGAAPVIVNQAFAGTFLPGRNPIGQTFEKIGDNSVPARLEIVGVVDTIRYNNLRELDYPSIYTPLRDISRATVNIRAASTSLAMTTYLKEQIESAAPGLKVRSSILLVSQIGNTLIGERLLALLAGFFSTVALLLAAVGLFGVINYLAVRRTREIGIRIALGARRLAVVRLIVSETSIPVTLGIVAGIIGGMGLARYLASQLFGVKPTDLSSLAIPVACILFASAAAVLPPAFRAASADPLIALRHE